MSNTKYITVLSVLSSIAVVYLHVNGCFWGFDRSAKWIGANIIECLFYFAVPVFFMISGATLIDYRARYDTKTYVKKRAVKTLVPFIIWSLIWCIVLNLHGEYDGQNIVFHKFFIEGILNSKFYSNYWFFVPLFVVYAEIIVLSLIPEESRQKLFLFLIVAGFLTISALPFLFSLLNIEYNNDLKFPVSGGGYVLFALIGYYINKYEIKLPYRITVYVLGLAGLLTHILGTQFASFEQGWLVMTYKGYLNVPSVLYATAIFMFFKYVKKTKSFDVVYKICKFISPMTFGVYLIHGLVIYLFINKLPFDSTHILFRVFGSLGVFILCAAIVWCIQRIPVIKKILP